MCSAVPGPSSSTSLRCAVPTHDPAKSALSTHCTGTHTVSGMFQTREHHHTGPGNGMIKAPVRAQSLTVTIPLVDPSPRFCMPLNITTASPERNSTVQLQMHSVKPWPTRPCHGTQSCQPQDRQLLDLYYEMKCTSSPCSLPQQCLTGPISSATWVTRPLSAPLTIPSCHNTHAHAATENMPCC